MKNHPFSSIGCSWETSDQTMAAHLALRSLSNSQAAASFGTAGANHGATAAGCHARPKSVRALAVNHRGLVGAFHYKTPEIIAKQTGD
jgi:hypothetical protein